MSNKIKKITNWYDSGYVISNLIILIIIVTIICSQSFVVTRDSSIAFFGSIINYNSIYLLVLVYFVLLKVKIGKRYFNYLNLFLVFLYFLASVTSFLTVIQSFGLKTLLDFVLNLVILIYLFHTMFRDTRIWKEFKLGNSPFNELTNDMYFYVLIVICLFTLAVKLISTVYISGVILSLLDSIYVVLLGRYIYLYRDYLDYNKKDIDNEGNFDEIKDNIHEITTDISEKVEEVTKEVDEKIDSAVEKVEEVTKDVNEKIDNAVEKVTDNNKKETTKKKKTTSKKKEDK